MKNRVIESVLRVLFGYWNGLQVFLIPITLFYLLDAYGVARWISGLLTHRAHYLPLALFLMLFLFVGFVILKRIAYDSERPPSSKSRSELISFVISLHEQLIVFFVCLVMIYGFSSFIRYFYGIQVSIRYVFAYSAQVFCIMLIVYNYVMDLWIRHYELNGHSRKRGVSYLLVYMRHNLWSFMRYTLLILVMIVFSVYVYRAIVLVVLAPLISVLGTYLGIEINFIIHQSTTGSVVMGNVWIIFVAFLCSNLLFSPIVWFLHRLLLALHPLKDMKTHQAPPIRSIEVSDEICPR